MFWWSDKITKAYMKNKPCVSKSQTRPFRETGNQSPYHVLSTIWTYSGFNSFFNCHNQEMTTNSHVLKVSIMYKYIYDFDPSFRGFNSALDWLYPYFTHSVIQPKWSFSTFHSVIQPKSSFFNLMKLTF